jgi:hypothetical protein
MERVERSQEAGEAGRSQRAARQALVGLPPVAGLSRPLVDGAPRHRPRKRKRPCDSLIHRMDSSCEPFL